MLQMQPERVRCIYLEGAGCYGRNGSDDCSSEAALIAKEIGQPVRLQWMRADEHGWDPKGPATLLDYRARIDEQNRIVAWESDIFLPERPMRRSGATLLAATLAKLPKFGPPNANLSNPGLGIPYVADQQQVDRALAPRYTVCRRPGYVRLAACRTPLATKASSTRSLPRRLWIRWKFVSAT